MSSSNLYPEIIKSRTLARQLLEREFYTEKYGKNLPLLAILTYGDEEPEVGVDTLIRSAAITLSAALTIEQNRQTSLFTLMVEAFEPQFAADLTMAVIEELDKLQRGFKSQKVSEKKSFVEDRIANVMAELEASEESLKQFRERNRQIANSPALLLEEDRLIREVEVQKGIFITLKQQYELVKIEEVEESSLVQVLDPPEPPLLRESPKRKRTVVMAGFVGIGLGIALAFTKEYFSRNDILKALSLRK